MVFVKKEDINSFILSHQPNIQNIEIRKIYPSNIKITLSSYKDLYNVNID
jgi:cell division septal protein FtsQ